MNDTAPPLDNPIWHALTTTHAPLAQGGTLALRYPMSIAPFAGLSAPTKAAFAELAEVVQPERIAATFTAEPFDTPTDWEAMRRQVISQMVCEKLNPVQKFELDTLTETDVPEMQALVELTHPGPFKPLTIRMGRYLGLRRDGKLVAMAGERLRMNGYSEVSAVCTHPEYQGRGYAKALVQAVAEEIFVRGEIPFLHVKTDNLGAVQAYLKLGFVERKKIHLAVLRYVG